MSDEVRWRIVEFPGVGAIGKTGFYITEEDVIVAEIIGDEETAYQIAKRLNEWEYLNHERQREDAQDRGHFDAMGG